MLLLVNVVVVLLLLLRSLVLLVVFGVGNGLQKTRGRFCLQLQVAVFSPNNPRDQHRAIGLGLGLGLRGSEGDVEFGGGRGRRTTNEARESTE